MAHQIWGLKRASESFDTFTRIFVPSAIASTAIATLVAAIAKVASVHFSCPMVERFALPALKVSAHSALLAATSLFGSATTRLFYFKL